MKNRGNNNLRKAHDSNSRIEEKNLWDLEDDWDDDTSPEPDAIEKEEAPAEKEDEATAPEPAEDESLENVKTKLGFEPKSKPDAEPAAEPETPSDKEEGETSDDDIATAEESEDNADDTVSSAGIKSEIEALISPLKKFSLSAVEKITLVTLAVALIGLGIWGYVFIYEKNNLAVTEATLNLPIEGKYATVTKLSTFWISAGKSAGIKLGVAVVPVAQITLDDESSSGALRVFFRDAEKNRVGDPITINFENGKFTAPNKTNISITDSGSTATVSATNGFQLESDFSAYQMDSTLTWKVHVLEADSSSAAGSSFEDLFNTGVEPKRQ